MFNDKIEALFKLNELKICIAELYIIFMKKISIERAEGTYRFYKNHLGKIKDWLLENNIVSTDQLSHTVLHSYIQHERGEGLKNNTINKRLKGLKTAMRYAQEIKLIDSNKIDNFKPLKADDVETKVVSKVDLKSILKYLNEQVLTYNNLERKLAFYLLLETGVRNSELLNILIRNIDFENNVILLTRTKTGKNRNIFFSELTKNMIIKYIELKKGESAFLFTEEKKNKPYSSTYNIGRKFRVIKKDLHLKISISPHKLRHSYATLCLNNGADLEFLRTTLGHSSLRVTQKYLHLNKDDLKQQHEKVNPLKYI